MRAAEYGKPDYCKRRNSCLINSPGGHLCNLVAHSTEINDSPESQTCNSVGPCSRHRALHISDMYSDHGQISKIACNISADSFPQQFFGTCDFCVDSIRQSEHETTWKVGGHKGISQADWFLCIRRRLTLHHHPQSGQIEVQRPTGPVKRTQSHRGLEAAVSVHWSALNQFDMRIVTTTKTESPTLLSPPFLPCPTPPSLFPASRYVPVS